MMLYQFHELSRASVTPVHLFAQAVRTIYSNPFLPLSYTALGRAIAAGAELVERTTQAYSKPQFRLPFTRVDGEKVAVREEILLSKPYCNLLHFQREGTEHRRDPRVLVFAPMSGHYATLLRGTVETLLPDHDVYITDWVDACDVPMSEGTFDLDNYIDYAIDFMRFLGPETHVMGVCQPSVPVLAAVSIMAAENHPCQPRSMTLMAGPVDTRISPTEVNQLATSKPYAWFEQMTHVVPFNRRGGGQMVYPGFLQLKGFMTMNLERHVGAHVGLFQDLVKGDASAATQHRSFYDEYLSVMDLPAAFYLQTIKEVFQEHRLPKGTMVSRGRKVDPSAIRNTALLTVEGEKDDITGIGQTEAAHRLCSSLPESMRRHHLQPNVGHYGTFNGRRWREEIYPNVRDFIKTHDSGVARPERPLLANQDAGGHEPKRVGKLVRRVRSVLSA